MVALHGQLCADHPLLQRGLRPQVTAECDREGPGLPLGPAPRPGLAPPNRTAAGGEIGGWVIDMPPAGQGTGSGILEHGLHLGLALHRDRLHPGLSQPLLVAVAQQFFIAKGEVADHTSVVQHQHHVGRGADQGSGGIDVQARKERLGRPKAARRPSVLEFPATSMAFLDQEGPPAPAGAARLSRATRASARSGASRPLLTAASAPTYAASSGRRLKRGPPTIMPTARLRAVWRTARMHSASCSRCTSAARTRRRRTR